MNAIVNAPKASLLFNHTGGRVWDGKVKLTHRALLLSVTLEDACRRLNRPLSHEMWPSAVYRELAAQETHHLFRRPHGRLCSRSLGAIVEDLRAQVRSSSPVPAHQIATLLFEAAQQYRVHNPILLRRLLDEVDAMVFRTAPCR